METTLIQTKIYDLRGLKVMLDFDLAELYETENRALKQSVKRNAARFPSDFMFQLTKEEWQELITVCDKLPKGVKFSPVPPLAFTEQGVAMLAGILKTRKAIEVNISIMRAFVEIRRYALNYGDLAERLRALEDKYDDVYDALKYLLNKDQQELEYEERNRIGYKQNG